MSFYYKYSFVSPEPVYAIIQEELKSYMDTGAVDSLMFPTYLDKCLRKLGRTSYVITEEILIVPNFARKISGAKTGVKLKVPTVKGFEI